MKELPKVISEARMVTLFGSTEATFTSALALSLLAEQTVRRSLRIHERHTSYIEPILFAITATAKISSPDEFLTVEIYIRSKDVCCRISCNTVQMHLVRLRIIVF